MRRYPCQEMHQNKKQDVFRDVVEIVVHDVLHPPLHHRHGGPQLALHHPHQALLFSPRAIYSHQTCTT